MQNFKKQCLRWMRIFKNRHLWSLHIKQIWSAFRQDGVRSAYIVIKAKLFSTNKKIPLEIMYRHWISLNEKLSRSNSKKIRKKIEQFSYKPLISIIMSVGNPSEPYLKDAIESVRQQLYPHWELYIVNDGSSLLNIRQLLETYAHQDHRIKIIIRENNGIVETLNSALTKVTGDFVTFLEQDSMLAERALYKVVQLLNLHQDTDLMYTDEDKINDKYQRSLPKFKTAWDPLLILSMNYVKHLAIYRTAIVKEIGGFKKEFVGAEDYDLLLRFIEKTTPKRLRHIPYVLYHSRVAENDSTVITKPYNPEATKVVSAYLQRNNISGEISANPFYQSWWRICFSMPKPLPKVSIIMPTRDRVDLLKMAVTGILDPTKTAYENFELIIVNNNSEKNETYEYFKEIEKDKRVKILTFNFPFNWSQINNFAIKNSDGDLVLLLNNDIEPINKDWLKNMVSYMSLPEVAVVGAKLYYPDNTIQHAAVVLGIGWVAGHMFAGLERDSSGYENHLLQARNCSAVTGACMLVRRNILQEVGGFDEQLAVAFNDIDFCLQIIKKNYRVVWSPFAELYHYESATRGRFSDLDSKNFQRFKAEINYMREKHGELLLNDPFYNPNLSLNSTRFDLAFPTRVNKL